jgi:hypothetical protein
VKKSIILVESSLTGSVAGNIVLAGVLGLAMKQIFALINTLQVVTQIPLLAVLIPANVETCLQGLMDVSNLNIIPKSVINKVLEWLGIKAIDEDMQAKKKTNLMDNIIYLLIAIGVAVLILSFLGILIYLSKSRPK